MYLSGIQFKKQNNEIEWIRQWSLKNDVKLTISMLSAATQLVCQGKMEQRGISEERFKYLFNVTESTQCI